MSALRVLPVQEVVRSTRILDFDSVRSIVRGARRIAVQRCPCRVRERRCDAPLEVCLSLDALADYVLKRKLGREIAGREALDILARSEQLGLVHQTTNSDHPDVICNCCTCCCTILRSVITHGSAASAVASRFRPVVDRERCTDCLACVRACHFGALVARGAKGARRAVQRAERCYGCGHCARVCRQEAIELREVRPPRHEHPDVPFTPSLLPPPRRAGGARRAARQAARTGSAPRTLLLFPPQHCLEETLRIWSFAYEANFPLAPLRMASGLRAAGGEVDFLDAFNVHENSPAGFAQATAPSRIVRQAPCGNFEQERRTKPVFHVGLPWDELEARLAALPPPDEILVSSIFTWSWQTTHRSIALARRVFPRARVRLGGVYPTLCPEQAAQTGAEVHQGTVPEVECARLDAELLARVPRLDGIVLKTSIGCPHRCSYCAVHVLEGRRVVFRDPSEVLDELDALAARLRFSRVFFWESNLLLRADRHLGKILDGLAARGNPFALQAPEGLQPSLVTPELAVRLRAAGFREIRLTQETTDAARLSESRRPSGFKHVAAAVAALRDAGFPAAELSVVLLIGQPGQTTEVILRDVARVYGLGVKTSFLVYTPIPRTADYARYAERIGDRPLEDLDSFLFPMASPSMTVAELDTILRYFHDRHLPLARIAASATEDGLVRRLQAMIRESGP